MSTMIVPNRSMRYSLKVRKYSGSRINTKAPTMTPRMEAMPPNTTIARIMADSRKVKQAGLMKVDLAAKITPASPAQVDRGQRPRVCHGGVDPHGLAGDFVFP
jgi:hypothetical protein